jgi:hypothetical protein
MLLLLQAHPGTIQMKYKSLVPSIDSYTTLVQDIDVIAVEEQTKQSQHAPQEPIQTLHQNPANQFYVLTHYATSYITKL